MHQHISQIFNKKKYFPPLISVTTGSEELHTSFNNVPSEELARRNHCPST